ncbi:hypothetical protein DPMN_031380 [Dreissena polymorpha]|uniref:Uncharacterized protein n=1 Tax=Dreissena polymorpha TaxID=45954 RepID=A0A9D4M2Q6_DREPO|nr:hypothetical protein DPMN_031380 [Dreissena polymorpha]
MLAEEIIRDLRLAMEVMKAQKQALTNQCSLKISINVCNYPEEHIVLEHHVKRLTMIKEIYLSYILKHHPS